MRVGSALEPKRCETEHDPKRDNRNRIDAVPRVAEVRSGGLDKLALFLHGKLEWQGNVMRDRGRATPLLWMHFVCVDLIHTA